MPFHNHKKFFFYVKRVQRVILLKLRPDEDLCVIDVAADVEGELCQDGGHDWEKPFHLYQTWKRRMVNMAI